MQVYRRKTLLSDDADCAAFTKFYGESVADKSHDPFLLIRDDGYRLLVITDDGMLMLSLASGPNDCLVSYASSYSDGIRSLVGLSRQLTAKDENLSTQNLRSRPFMRSLIASKYPNMSNFVVALRILRSRIFRHQWASESGSNESCGNANRRHPRATIGHARRLRVSRRCSR